MEIEFLLGGVHRIVAVPLWCTSSQEPKRDPTSAHTPRVGGSAFATLEQRQQALAAAVILIVLFLASTSSFCQSTATNANSTFTQPSSDPTSAKNVLVLYSLSDPNVYDSSETLEAAVRSRVHAPVTFHIRYMETQHNDDPAFDRSQAETFHIEYRNLHIDLVIVAGYPALQFAVAHRDEIFPGAPIIFSYVVPERFRHQPVPPGVTGVIERADIEGSIELALRLQPDTKNVALVSGSSEFDKYVRGMFHEAFRPYQQRAELLELVGLPAEDLLRQVAALPPHTLVFFALYPQVSLQPMLGNYELMRRIADQRPLYCFHSNYCLGRGGIGGNWAELREQTEKTAELAGPLLSGVKPENVPVIQGSPARSHVDWRELSKWKIPGSALPPGTVVLYREPSTWERHKWTIIVAVALFLVQAVLIAGLLWHRAAKLKVEASLRESEARFRTMADAAPTLIWMSDANGNFTYLSDQWVEFTGSEKNAGLGKGFARFIHPEDVEQALNCFPRKASRGKKMAREYRLRRNDGSYRWMFDIAVCCSAGHNGCTRFIGSAIDVSNQKLAQEELGKLSGKLIQAQENERARIARELHDDICQQLALLSMRLDRTTKQAQGLMAPAAVEMSQVTGAIEKATQLCSQIARNVQLLSHKLHSSSLHYLGLVPAVREFCLEFSEQHSVSVDFKTVSVPAELPADVALCVFRVVQEGLRNAIKHSGSSNFEVSVRGKDGFLEFSIHDDGVGFDPAGVPGKGGLGLVSMQERLNLVSGTLHVDSKPKAGTTILARIPLSMDMQARSA
jgi:PAS domain S-box-containing protein